MPSTENRFKKFNEDEKNILEEALMRFYAQADGDDFYTKREIAKMKKSAKKMFKELRS